jgi:hypothetical protein
MNTIFWIALSLVAGAAIPLDGAFEIALGAEAAA